MDSHENPAGNQPRRFKLTVGVLMLFVVAMAFGALYLRYLDRPWNIVITKGAEQVNPGLVKSIDGRTVIRIERNAPRAANRLETIKDRLTKRGIEFYIE